MESEVAVIIRHAMTAMLGSGQNLQMGVWTTFTQEAREASDLQKGKLESLHTGLTPREVEILQLIAEGYPNKGIAAHLGITLKTVGNHREHIMAKLDLHDAAGLTRYAIRTGIIESGGLGGILG